MRPLDEDQREAGLRELRRRNNERILDLMERWLPLHGARVLDVGAAHGWFVDAARRRGADAVGIEPAEAVVARAVADPDAMRVGTFPDALAPGEMWDAITFNDVIEHLERPDEVVDECSRRVRSGGLLVLNLPTTEGVLFRLARKVRRIGVQSLFDRLWQKDLPSPHLWYFSADAVTRMVQRYDFELVHAGRLHAVCRSGLYGRVHADRRPSPVTLATVAGVAAASVLLNSRGASDIAVLAYRRRG